MAQAPCPQPLPRRLRNDGRTADKVFAGATANRELQPQRRSRTVDASPPRSERTNRREPAEVVRPLPLAPIVERAAIRDRSALLSASANQARVQDRDDRCPRGP